MKRKLLISCMTAVAALLTTSCTSDLALLEGGTTVNGVDGEEVEVTFSVSTENSQAVTRATRTDETGKKPKGPGYKQTVGRGSKVDMLIYAVYEKDGDDYVLLKQYGDGTIPSELEDSVAFGDNTSHDGQTIVYDPFDMKNANNSAENNNGTYNITLRLMRGKEYSIAFWAQSSATAAYVTDNLEKVQVIYGNAKNNDELRDAFCKVENFTLGADGSSRTVVLTRPLAQINVGTTGADYETIRKSRDPQRFVAYSEITLKGVAQYMNVVTDKIDGTAENLTTASFTRSVIPAYMNGNLEKFKTNEGTGEEFLYVDLNANGKIDVGTNTKDGDDSEGYTDSGYKTKYPTVDKKTGEALTETFKYLSMCYVLVPATTTTKPNYDADNETPDNEIKQDSYYSSTLEEIEVSFAESSDGSIGFPPVILVQVPVHRNWRTNILGGLYDREIPNEDDEDDPNSVFKLPAIYVTKDVTYDGDYNYPDSGPWTENPEQSDKGSTEEEAEKENGQEQNEK